MILYPLIISIKIDELSNSTLGVKTISRVKSREHTRDLKRVVGLKKIQDKCVAYRYRFERGVDKKYMTNEFIRFES